MDKIVKKLLKTIAVTALLMYSCLTLFKQEVAFNEYDKELYKYESLTQEEAMKKEQLLDTKEKISSREYIEEIAREKLGFVMPNEIVFVDANL